MKLEPCPCCGGSARQEVNNGVARVQCSCGLAMGSWILNESSVTASNRVAEKWNRRTHPVESRPSQIKPPHGTGCASDFGKHLSAIEEHPQESLKNFGLVISYPKADLVRFCNAIIGGSWTNLRRESKSQLVRRIVEWASK